MSKPLVLVTGATGHIGFRTLVIALQQGYRTRVALRKAEQIDKIKATASVKPYLDSVEFVVVPDITADKAYDEAIKGVEYVLHVASPIYSNLDPNDHDWKKLLYAPAIRGTTSILEAAEKESSVKRIVITSSVAALNFPTSDGSPVGAYNLRPIPDQETLDNLPLSTDAYTMSKALSHQAGTKFVEQRKPAFDLIRVLPGYVQGANELYTSAEQMRQEGALGSNEGTMSVALGKELIAAPRSPKITVQVFLDDIAKAHVFALRQGGAKNGENLVVVGNGGKSVDWKDFVPIVQRLFPQAVKKGVLCPKVQADSGLVNFDVSDSEKALGFKFAGPEEMVRSVVGQYLRLLGEEEK